jgi:tetratricopeptide (TPR) repeat protein
MLAARVVSDRAGHVFALRPGAEIVEGDIEFAASLFPSGRTFFVVDNGAEHSAALHANWFRLRETHVPALFLIGEHLNEWRVSRGTFGVHEYLLDPLSDSEIERLLEMLERHDELGELAPLSRELRVAAIKQKHGKELLVVLREATEDNDFDAILEEEFRGIPDDLSKKTYLAVCCFSQHNALLRDTLLSQILETPLADLHLATANATEGVVIFDLLDPVSGRYVARARHRTIAAVVWQRCGDQAEKEGLLQKAIRSVNLSYKADREAFESLVRSDRLVDSIRTLEGRVNYFEAACSKEPANPYIRQHFARMLSRANQPELALSQIDRALSLNANSRVLYHTRGHILSKLAIRCEAIEVGRKYMVQAERALMRAISMSSRDEYSFSTLASLYLDWAKKVTDPGESSEYVKKCEETLNEGFRNVVTRDALWLVSADVEEWLGNEPNRLKALERAVKESPKSVVARYILARAYRRQHLPESAIQILQPVVKEQAVDEFRSCIEYALALYDMGRSLPECIAVLKLGSLYGMADPRFIATLGGMLYLNREFTEAKNVFSHSSRQDFTTVEATAPKFRPTQPGSDERLRFRGTVRIVRAGFAIIETPDYPDFFCRSSKYGQLVLRRNLEVEFQPAFSARQALAEKPQATD